MNISDPAFHLSGPLALPDSEVQLWRVDLEALAQAEDRWQQLLSADERARARRFLVPRVRQHFAATRGMLRTILSGYLTADPAELTFHYSSKDKPSLAPPYAASGISFNVAHSGGVALLAFVRGRAVGVDVERVRRNLDVQAVARRFFSAHEQEQLAVVAPEHIYEAFFRCWTRKEAYIKAKGEGLWMPLNQFDVSLASGAANALLATRPDRTEADRWSLREVAVGSGYAAALCVSGRDFKVRSWESAEL